MSRKHTGCIDHSLLRIYLTSPQKPVGLLNHLSNPAIVSCILESFRNIPGNLTISGRCLCWEQDVSWSHGSLGCMQPDAIFHQMTYGTQKGWSWAIRSCLFVPWILRWLILRVPFETLDPGREEGCSKLSHGQGCWHCIKPRQFIWADAPNGTSKKLQVML